MALRQIEFQLREWNEDDFASLKKNREAIRDLSRKIGTGSDRFQTAYNQTKELVLTGRSEQIPSTIKAPIDVRAFIEIIGENEFYENSEITVSMIDCLSSLKFKISRICLFRLVDIFFLRVYPKTGQQDKVVCLR